MLGVPDHPGKELGGRGDRAERRAETRGPAQRRRRLRRERRPDCGREEERPDEMRSAALVLLPPRLVVLVRADRDVLGTVVGGEARAAQGQSRGSERESAREELLCEWPDPPR